MKQGLVRAPLYTLRLLLRPYELVDAPAFANVLLQNPTRLRPSFPDRLRAVPSAANAPAVLAEFTEDWRTGRFYVFGIWHRATNVYIGDICLMPQAAGVAELGYYLAQEAEGHGYAREALAAIVAFGFEQVIAQKLLVRCFADNVRGQAVALAAGFRADTQPRPRSWWRSVALEASIRYFIQEP